MALIPKSFTVEKHIYEQFKKKCEDKCISISKWLRQVMIKQMKKWDNEN